MQATDTETAERIQPGALDRGSIELSSAPPLALWSALRASWLVVLVVILIGVGAGVAYGLRRKPSYTATAQLSVLRLDFGAPGALAGFSTAAAALADAYSRAIDADGVVMPLARRFHTTPQAIDAELNAAAVPQSPIFSVTATTKSAARSILLANAAADQLVTYFQQVNRSNPDRHKLFTQLERAEGTLAASHTTLQLTQASVQRAMGARAASSPTAAQQRALDAASSAVQVAQDRVNALRNAYTQNVSSTSATQFVQPLAAPLTATSDRSSKLALLGFIGLAAGLGIGAALALARQARQRARALRV